MNNILNEITYCDGRIVNNSSSILEDSPSRLKLRPNTFDGIRSSYGARRTPAFNIAEFAIPTANMASGVYTTEGESGTAGGGITATPSEEFKLNESVEIPNVLSTPVPARKVRLNPEQFDKVIKRTIVDKPAEVQQPQVDNSIPEVTPVVDAQQNEEVNENVQDLPVVEAVQQEVPVVNQIETPVVEKETVVATPVEEAAPTIVEVQAEAPIATTPVETVSETEKEVDDFTKLQRVTEEYQKVSQEYNVAKEGLTTAEQELTTSKEKLEELEKAISEKNEELATQRSVIDTKKKDIVEINEKIKEVKEEIKNKIDLVTKAKNDMARKLKELQEETRQKTETNERYRQDIQNNTEELEKMHKESESLVEEENKVISEISERRSKLKGLEEMRDAITTLPGQILEASRESEDVVISNGDVVDDVVSLPVNEENNALELEEPKVLKKIV